MSIGDSITLVSCLAGLMVALPGLMIFLSMIYGRTADRATARLAKGAILPFFAGLGTMLVLGYFSLVLIGLGSVFQLVGDMTMLLLLAWLFSGISVVASFIGLKFGQIAPLVSDQITGGTMRERVIGVFTLTLAAAFPLVGWFLVLPLSCIVGSGAMLLAIIRRRSSRQPAPQPLAAPEYVAGG